ncbi:MAG: hypothetical protein FWF67_08615 [Fibromonadales bacterium]|nr:hypothetical protein [Fibromonadales bacterium]
MKKKLSIFLCVFAALFFGSCSDLSVSEEVALKADLPADFDWQDYGEINIDVLKSQIVLDLRKTKRGQDSIANCVGVLSDTSVAREIFSNYLRCPKEGWDKKKGCTGIYANNSNYNKLTITTITTNKVDTTGYRIDSIPIIVYPPDSEPDTTGYTLDTVPITVVTPTVKQDTALCSIDACWSGGWNDLANFLPDSLAKYLATSQTGLRAIRAMCQFVPENSTPADTKNYLDSFEPDPVLIITHYKSYGRNDGRPYKYCEDGHKGEERNQETHADKRGSYYDYGRYTFCLDKTDEKIYVVK